MRRGIINAALRLARQAGGRAEDLTTENLVKDLPAAGRRARFAEIFGRPPEDVSPLGDTARFLKEEALPMAVGAALPMIPKKVVAPAVAGLAGLLLNSDQGEAADKGRKPSTTPTADTLPKLPGSSIEGMLPSSVANDPTVKLLMQQIKEQRAIADSPVRPEMSKLTREGAIAQSAALQQKLNERIAELTKASQPWKQAHPEWASAWPAVQVGAPMIAGLAAKNVADLATRAWNRPWNKAVNAAEEALFQQKPGTPPNVMRGEYETKKATGYEKARGEQPSHFWSGVREHAVPAIAGGAAGVEAAMFPYQFDARNAPEGSAEQKAGQAALDDPLGTAWKWGGLGALTGWAAPHIVPGVGPGRHPGPETKALQDYMAGLKTPSPGAAANSATSPARGLASSEALPPLSPASSEAGLPLMRQSLLENMAKAQKALPPPEPVVSPSPPARAKRSTSERAPKTPREEAESYFKKPSKNKASSPGDQDYPTTPDDKFQRGGIVGQALRIAKQNGGAVVHAGPIQHAADGGRTDTVPLDVAPGSYVIPADIISGIGQGDTSAGYRALSEMFGHQAPKPAQGAGGPPVPILAAGGEFVISPEVVGKVGGGDLKRGHEALDLWVKMQRRKIIQELSKLPGPAKD